MVDLAKSLHMIGDERDGDHANFSNPFRRQIAEGAVQRWLQPFAGANLALVTKPVAVGPSAALHKQLDALLDLALIGIALFDHRERNAVRAENDLRSLRRGKTGQRFLHFFHQDRKSTRLNSSHGSISYAVFCLKKKTNTSCIL